MKQILLTVFLLFLAIHTIVLGISGFMLMQNILPKEGNFFGVGLLMCIVSVFQSLLMLWVFIIKGGNIHKINNNKGE